MAETSMNLGRVSLVPRGAYSPTAQYERLDIVQYEGASYLALRSVQGVTPVNGADYMLLAAKGDAGADGAQGPAGPKGDTGNTGPQGPAGNSISIPVSVANGGTGQTSLTSGAALVGNGTSAVSTRSITNNTSTTSSITASTNLATMNTLRYALNRTTGPGSADTNYSTAMMRAIYAGTSDLTAGSSSLTSGQIYLVYE